MKKLLAVLCLTTMCGICFADTSNVTINITINNHVSGTASGGTPPTLQPSAPKAAQSTNASRFRQWGRPRSTPGVNRGVVVSTNQSASTPTSQLTASATATVTVTNTPAATNAPAAPTNAPASTVIAPTNPPAATAPTNPPAVQPPPAAPQPQPTAAPAPQPTASVDPVTAARQRTAMLKEQLAQAKLEAEIERTKNPLKPKIADSPQFEVYEPQLSPQEEMLMNERFNTVMMAEKARQAMIAARTQQALYGRGYGSSSFNYSGYRFGGPSLSMRGVYSTGYGSYARVMPGHCKPQTIRCRTKK